MAHKVFAVLFAQAVGDVLNYDPSVLLTRDGDYDAAVKYWSSLEALDISGHTGDILCDWQV